MKPSRSNELKAGLFLLAAAILLGAVMLKISGTLDLLTRETYHVRARFDNTLGIAPMTKVTLNGVKVGRVTDIRLIELPRETQVEVGLELDRAQARLHEGAYALITAETFLSEKHVDLRPGRPERPLVAEGTILPGTSPPDINLTLAKVDESIAAVRDLVTDEQIRSQIQGIFADVRAMVADLRKLSLDLDGVVVQNRAKVASVLDNAKACSQNIQKITERIDQSVQQTQDELLQLIRSAHSLVDENRPDIRAVVEQTRQSMQAVSGQVDSILQDLDRVADQLNQVVGGNRDELDRILHNLDRTSENARRFSRQLADYPWQLLYPSEKRRQAERLFPAWEPLPATGEMKAE